MDTFSFSRATASQRAIYVTRSALSSMGKRRFDRIVVSHGARTLDARIIPILERGRTIPVSRDLFDGLGLMEALPYRIRWTGREIRIGPVIGIHARRKTSSLDTSSGSPLNLYFGRYPDVNGLGYVFADDGVDVGKDTVRGYYWKPDDSRPYSNPGMASGNTERLARRVMHTAKAEVQTPPQNPRTMRFQSMAAEFARQRGHAVEPVIGKPVAYPGAGRLEEGLFPVPSAVWRRCGYMPPGLLSYFGSRLGNRVFNSHFFDKYEAYQMASTDPRIGGNVPMTVPFTDLDGLMDLLEIDGEAVLKRRDGNSGYGMLKIELRAGQFVVRYRDRPLVETMDRAALEALLRPLTQGEYLFQQYVDLPVHNGRPVDFRIMMQKDDLGEWVPQGVLGRFGRSGAIVTSFINSGYAVPADEALCAAFGTGWREAYAMKARLLDFAFDVCRSLDEGGGCYGDLGLDIGIDRERRLWLFGINKLPFHELPRYMGDDQMYLAVKSGPLLYGAYLAGFGRQRESVRS